MPGPNRSAFTLVELLVVVVIIGILVGLLMPAVIGARARARQTQCSNNQHELALAVQGYESDKDHLPGYINNFGASINTNRLSWLVVVLPYLGREDLWVEWRDANRTYYPYKQRNAMVDLPQLRCPSDSRAGWELPRNLDRAWLSYVANCGIQAGTYTPDAAGNPTVPEGPAHGVFQNRAVANPVPFASDRIPDGTSNTLLFSESLQATLWAPPLIDNLNTETWTGLVDPVAGPDLREAHVGMVWVWTPLNGDPGPCREINECKDAEVQVYDTAGPPLNPPQLKPPYDDPATTPLMAVARPSSYHVGGVVVTYADGHQDFFAEDEREVRGTVEFKTYAIYQRLMAPDDDKAGLVP